ncbi:hypothetical protein FB564_3643 [Salinispora arenicola]|uniref:Uncharacterized protein n=1 Tax=Salinispora arenicola TaxID=168697 RepID=A0A542XS11_SALAC|nr:hypothetical protein FB564_3643 [Salinispora arenicola]
MTTLGVGRSTRYRALWSDEGADQSSSVSGWGSSPSMSAEWVP